MYLHKHPDVRWPRHDDVVALGRRLIDGRLCGLVGARGTGKTLIAAWLAQELKSHGYLTHTMYFTGADLFGLMKSWYSIPGADAGHNNRLLVDVPLLVIDEMQERVESEHEDKMLTHLIDKRYGACRPTLIIANLMPEPFVRHVGPSIASRITEGGTLLVCNWPSYRGAQ
jgi:DNA replication protein DnaC